MEIMPKLISQYLASGEYVRKLSPNTLKAYRIDLLQFSEFVGGEWPSSNELNEYIKYLNQKFNPRSVKRKLASVRAFYRNLEENNIMIDAQSPVFPRLKRSRCRSSQEVNDSPTPFSALNYCLPICAKASFSLSKPNIAAYETRNPRTTAATTIYHTTAIALIWQ